MAKRITFDDAARQALRRGVDQLAGAVRVTLGPRGRHVVIERLDGAPSITNDGFAIAQEIELPDRLEDLGVRMLREVASQTAAAAGDGTTTALVLAQALIVDGLRAVTAGQRPMALKRGIDQAVAAVVASLRASSRKLERPEEIAHVATIAARQDEALGELIAEAMARVGRNGVITVEEGRGTSTTLDVVEGLSFDQGYLSPYFVTDPSDMAVKLEDPLLLLTDRKLSAVGEVVTALELAANASRPLLVVAEDVEGEALATLVVNRLRGTAISVAVRAPANGEVQRAMLEDLAVLTGSRLLTRESGLSLERLIEQDLGRAKRAEINRDSTVVLEGGGRPREIRERITSLENELKKAHRESEREPLRTRLARLSGGVAVLRVGAHTEPEMHERKSRLEDALAATRAAVEEGIVPGGGVALLRAQGAIDELKLEGDARIGANLVRKALEAPLRLIASNAGENGAIAVERVRQGAGGFGYDALRGEYADLAERGILDATKVVRSALENAASIATLILTTDAVVVEADEDEQPPE
jgi:chaperonin GroEL